MSNGMTPSRAHVSAPPLFVTLSPPDQDPVPILRLHCSCGVLDIAAIDKKLREVSNRYPAATARIYERILWSFTRCFLGIVRLPASVDTGAFTAYFGVTETQGRGSLHFHVWGGPSTEVMSEVCDDADLIS